MDKKSTIDYRPLMEKALLKIETLKREVSELKQIKTEPIAVVGMGLRLPGNADDADSYWEMLCNGRDGICEIPKSRFDVDELYDPDPDRPGKIYLREAGLLSDIDKFDPYFFEMSPRETEMTDPQQRLLMTVCWESLESAGIPPERLKKTETGVFIGVMNQDYSHLAYKPERIDIHSATGNAASVDSGRIAHYFGTRGPAVTVDTACSSSLVSVHLACQSLRMGECNLALAGGVNLILTPIVMFLECRAHMLSPGGRCKTFDKDADGFGRGEGCGIVVLKRLSDALADEDNILAVIRSSAVNHDGRSSGITVPNGPSQQAVIKKALADGEIDPGEIGYIEAHGTGTALGDPIELGALNAVFGASRSAGNPLVVGSAKSNFGHLEGAAGIAGLIKTILILKNREIPPNLHFNSPTPHFDWNSSPFSVPTDRTPFKPASGKYLAGVSSFGFSGTNAHVILESAPGKEVRHEKREEFGPHLLTLSARTPDGLKRIAERYGTLLRDSKPGRLGDVCFTSRLGRSHFKHRLGLVAENESEAVKALAAFENGEPAPGLAVKKTQDESSPKIAFLFTGQGSQYPGMAKALYENCPDFRNILDRCGEILAPRLDMPLVRVLNEDLINRTEYTQPALFAVEYALAKLWESWGIVPQCVMGHSVGEYVAACVAGIFGLEDGLRLIAERGRLMGELPENGKMAAVMADPQTVSEAVRPYEGQASIAAENGPTNTVVSGRADVIEKLCEAFKTKGVRCVELDVSHAFHSPLVEPMISKFHDSAKSVSWSDPKTDIVSNVTGKLAKTEMASADYWAEHIRKPVRFATSMETLKNEGCNVFVEIGPKPVLLGMGKQCVEDGGELWLPSLKQGESDWKRLFLSLGELYVHGASPDWSGFEKIYTDNGVRHAFAKVPFYSFEKRRYWIPGSDVKSVERKQSGLHPMIDRKFDAPLLNATIFETDFQPDRPYLRDHLVFGRVIVSGACNISLLVGAAALAFNETGCRLKDVLFQKALSVPDEGRTVQVSLQIDDGPASFTVGSLKGGAHLSKNDFTTHTTGKIELLREQTESNPYGANGEIKNRCGTGIDPEDFYLAQEKRKIELGPTYRWLDTVYIGKKEAICRLKTPDEIEKGFRLHPGLIDSCFGLLVAMSDIDSKGAFVPFYLNEFKFYRESSHGEFWCHAQIRETAGADRFVGDLLLYDRNGVIAEFTGLEGRSASEEVFADEEDAGRDLLYEISWQRADEEPNRENEVGEKWIVFGGPDGFGEMIAETMNAIPVLQGPSYAKTADERYEIDFTNASDYKQLMADVNSDGECAGIVFPVSEAAGEICVSALFLVQSLLEMKWRSHPRLYFATRSAQHVVENDPVLGVDQSPVWGLGRVVGVEHPEFRCTCVDLEDDSSESVRFLTREFEIRSDETQVAQRNGLRYAARLQPAPDFGQNEKLPEIETDGTYLITGGMGGVGLQTADWLAEKGAKNLVLSGRGGPSENARIRIDALKEKGVNAVAEKADIANPEDVERLVKKISETMPPLKGIVHSAGVLNDGILKRQDRERFLRVMSPKIDGAWNLHECTKNMPLDFFVCYSSAASMLGSAGQGNYCAANAFLDAFAFYRKNLGLPCLTVNWGPWENVGMAATLEEKDAARMKSFGLEAVGSSEYFGLLEKSPARKNGQIGVMKMDWPELFEYNRFYRENKFFAPFHKRIRKKKQEFQVCNRLKDAPEDDRHEMLCGCIVSLVNEVLRIPDSESPGVREPLFDFGVDSLMAVEMKNRLEANLGIELHATLIFDYPTIEGIAGYLLSDVLDFKAPEEKTEAKEDAKTDEMEKNIEELSETEAEALLLKELEAFDLE